MQKAEISTLDGFNSTTETNKITTIYPDNSLDLETEEEQIKRRYQEYLEREDWWHCCRDSEY